MEPLNPTSNDPNDPSAVVGGPASHTDGSLPLHNNSKIHMSTLRPSVPMTFPPLIPPPRHLPPRPPPQHPALEELDAVYNQSDHPMLGRGRAWEEDETRNKKALIVLQKHIDDRLPYIQLSSQRLQAATGTRNERIFDLPQIPIQFLNTPMRSLYSMPDAVFNTVDAGGMRAIAAARVGGRDGAMNFGMAQKSPFGMTRTVDKDTGEGLREFLLLKGKEFGMRKKECSGISFHDFTPCMRTGDHRNEPLGHFVVDGPRERVDIYEVNLPTTYSSGENMAPVLMMEPWIWVLISRPVVSFDPSDSSTQPPPKNSTQRSHHPIPPPNFPYPIPHSWLVFAAPRAHIVAYPEMIDPSFEPPDNAQSPYPFMRDVPNTTVGKRMDFDFSFSGMPLFEFCSRDLFNSHAGSDGKGVEFLSVENIGSWHKADPFDEYTEAQYKRLLRQWEAGVKSGVDTFSAPQSEDDVFGEDGGDEGKGPMPAPIKGLWWKEFYQKMRADCERWDKIKKAMGRGKCRVVIQWVEEQIPDLDLDLELGDVGAGSGPDGVTAGPDVTMGAGGRRMTRAEMRRQSAVAISDRLSGLNMFSGSRGGLRESARVRSAGNRDLARVAAMGSVREKGKGKK